jgi:response regulator of citrate/malate metabolism
MVNDPSIASKQSINRWRLSFRREISEAMFYVRGASFWQQDQAWRSRSAANQQDMDVVTAVTSKMSTALTNLSGGLASIANQRALARVRAQIKTATAAAVKSGTISPTSRTATSGTAGSIVNKTA